MIDDKDVFLHNYSQLAEMLREYLNAMAAVNKLSMQYLHNNDSILIEIADSSYYVYQSMLSLIRALSAAGDEVAKESVADSKEFSDRVEDGWRKVKNALSGKVPNLNHPLLDLNFMVGKETEYDSGEKDE